MSDVPSNESHRNALKRAAAEAAVELVEDGMVIGLGTGSTAAFVVEALARRHRQGLHFLGIPTSERTAAQAKAAGIPLSSFAEHRQIDLTIDGADEVERGTLNLIKGLAAPCCARRSLPTQAGVSPSSSMAPSWSIDWGRMRRCRSRSSTSGWKSPGRPWKCSPRRFGRA